MVSREQPARRSIHSGSSSGLIGRSVTSVPSLNLDLPDELLGIGAQGQVGVGLCTAGGAGLDDDPGVEGQDAAGPDEQGIDVELGDLGEVGGEIGQADEGLDEPVDVGRRPAAVALEERPDLERFEHEAGQALVERREAEGPVAEELGRRSRPRRP